MGDKFLEQIRSLLHREHASENRCLTVLTFGDGKVNVAKRAVLALGDDIATDANDLRLAGREVVLEVLVVVDRVLLGHEHLHILADNLRRKSGNKINLKGN